MTAWEFFMEHWVVFTALISVFLLLIVVTIHDVLIALVKRKDHAESNNDKPG